MAMVQIALGACRQPSKISSHPYNVLPTHRFPRHDSPKVQKYSRYMHRHVFEVHSVGFRVFRKLDYGNHIPCTIIPHTILYARSLL